MKQKTKDLVCVCILFFCFFFLGFTTSQIYNEKEDNSFGRNLDGLAFFDADYEYVKNYTRANDKYGDWVCVNINGMSFERALEVCKHETGHEIFAEICEKDIEKCFKIVEEIKK